MNKPSATLAGGEHKSPPPSAGYDLDIIKAEIGGLNDPEKEKAYFLTLPVAAKSDAGLRAWLKERKERREQEAQNAAADGLF
jgi:hypothetical protein